MLKKNISQGFTLLEILLVVGIIAILAGIVILAINPSKQLADTRNAQRKMDVKTIADAVYQYYIDNGRIPSAASTTNATCTTTKNEICQDEGTCTSLINFYSTLVTASSTYLSAIPRDPSVTAAAGLGSGYYIGKQTSGRITVCAPNTENGATMISITK